MDRIHKGTDSLEKKRQSGGSSQSSGSQNPDPGLRETTIHEEPTNEADAGSTANSEEEGESRTLFFNQPLPDYYKDEEGNPTQTYTRNKIRTAKYTPLSFIPKNIWFQFHNIANIFFLFNDILIVSLCPPLLLRRHIPNCDPSFFLYSEEPTLVSTPYLYFLSFS